jgi:hypothetical protein
MRRRAETWLWADRTAEADFTLMLEHKREMIRWAPNDAFRIIACRGMSDRHDALKLTGARRSLGCDEGTAASPQILTFTAANWRADALHGHIGAA